MVEEAKQLKRVKDNKKTSFSKNPVALKYDKALKTASPHNKSTNQANDNYTFNSAWCLFKENPHQMSLVVQGQISDCWIISAISAIAVRGQNYLKKNFITKNLSQEYTFKFFIQGIWKEITINDKLNVNAENRLVLARGQHCQLFVSLWEKCLAEYFGSYSSLEGGHVEQGFFLLLGRPSKTIYFEEGITEDKKEKIWSDLQDDYRYHAIAVSSKDQLDPNDSLSLEPKHVYSVCDVPHEFVEGKRKLRLRSTHIKEAFDEFGEFEIDFANLFEYFSCITKCCLRYNRQEQRFSHQVRYVPEGIIFNTGSDKSELAITVFHHEYKRTAKNYTDFWIFVLKSNQNNKFVYQQSHYVTKCPHESLFLDLSSGTYLVFSWGFDKEFEGIIQFSYLKEPRIISSPSPVENFLTHVKNRVKDYCDDSNTDDNYTFKKNNVEFSLERGVLTVKIDDQNYTCEPEKKVLLQNIVGTSIS